MQRDNCRLASLVSKDKRLVHTNIALFLYVLNSSFDSTDEGPQIFQLIAHVLLHSLVISVYAIVELFDVFFAFHYLVKVNPEVGFHGSLDLLAGELFRIGNRKLGVEKLVVLLALLFPFLRTQFCCESMHAKSIITSFSLSCLRELILFPIAA